MGRKNEKQTMQFCWRCGDYAIKILSDSFSTTFALSAQ
jgi:ribosomal protein L37E